MKLRTKFLIVKLALVWPIPWVLLLVGFNWKDVLPAVLLSVGATAGVLTQQGAAVMPRAWASLGVQLLALWGLQAGICHTVRWTFDHSPWLDPITKFDKPEDRLVFGGARAVEAPGSPKFLEGESQPKFSVILPCANEGLFSKKTAQSIYDTTPAHILHEIIIVDDGSSPPLKTLFTDEEERRLKIKWVRHEKFTGLINAKQQGGNIATGDIMVFLDCHVKPETSDWWAPLSRKIRSNYRRIVTPVVTSLDPDTWEVQKKYHDPATKCCKLTWNVDFKWFKEPGSDLIPIMIGGLLAMSRQWWLETGGYDTRMEGWGGENIDQTLRTWLCGGEVVQASDSFVAHMWRLKDKPNTKANYKPPEGSLNRNRYLAAYWYGPWRAKVDTLEGFRSFSQGLATPPNTSNLEEVQRRLQCKPFAWYLWRFKYLYEDVGLLPQQAFRLREKTTGLCASRVFSSKDAWSLEAVPCHAGDPDVNSGQIFHRANRQAGGACCAGYRLWNTEQCMWALGDSVMGHNCVPGGEDAKQRVDIDGDGRMRFEGGACVALDAPEKASTEMRVLATQCVKGFGFRREEVAAAEALPGRTAGKAVDGGPSYRLVETKSGRCLTAQTEDFTVLPCQSPPPAAQQFRLSPLMGGVRVMPVDHVGELCADAGADKLLLYPCYPEEANNQNQAFVFEADGRMRSHSAKCAMFPGSALQLRGCSQAAEGADMVRGQGFEEHMRDGKWVNLRETGGQQCIVRGDGNKLTLGPCDVADEEQLFWFDAPVMRHKASNLCMDTNDGVTPILYPCYSKEVLNDKQHFRLTEGKMLQEFHGLQCVTFGAPPPRRLVARPCAKVDERWEEVWPFTPLETRLYNDAKRERPALFATEYSK